MIKIGCDMCGRAGELYRAIVEDVELNVCAGCSKFGKVMGAAGREEKKVQHHAAKGGGEKIEMLIENFAGLIKSKREQSGLTQKEFAMRINEKESVVHKIETGGLEPTIQLARKLEKMLKIRLIEEHEETGEKPEKAKVEGFTIGDFIRIK